MISTTLALTIPTSVALPAAFLIHHRGFTALRAQVADLHRLVIEGGFRFFLDLMTHRPSATVAVGLFLQPGKCTCFFTQVDVEHLPDAIRQGAHAVGSQPEGSSPTDAAQLADDLAQAVGLFDGRGHAQDVGDETPDGFRDRSSF